MNCDKKVETQYIGEIAVDSLDSVPDYILAERDITDVETGDTTRSIVRVPGQKLFPNGNYANVIALETNNPDLTIPERGVVAGYIKGDVSANIMYPADANHAPQFLMLGKFGTAQMLVQNTGFVLITEGHDYIVGQDYWLGEEGEPTTEDTSGVHLFVPVSKTRLAIDIYKR